LTAFALPQLAAAHARGADAGAFLHAQLSADIAGLKDGEATFACYCSPRGQVYGLLLVGRHGDEYLLAADAELLPEMLRRLGLFVLRARVEFVLAPNIALSGLTASEGAARQGLAFEAPGPGLRYLFSAPPAAPASAAEWKARELRSNVVWLNRSTSERFIPQMLGFDRIGAVSFKKGCYPGQEIIARARYLGQVKRQPLLLDVSGAASWRPGESLSLQDGQEQLQATIVDSLVQAGEEGAPASLLFLVAPAPAHGVESLEYEGRSYRCATM